MRQISFLIAFMLMYAPGVENAHAASLKEKKIMKDAEKKLTKAMGTLETGKCKTKLQTKIDWPAFEKAPEGYLNRYSIPMWCDISFALSEICRKYGPEPIQAFSTYTCTYRPHEDGDKGKRYFIDASKPNLTMGFDFSAVNKDKFVIKWLEENLE